MLVLQENGFLSDHFGVKRGCYFLSGNSLLSTVFHSEDCTMDSSHNIW